MDPTIGPPCRRRGARGERLGQFRRNCRLEGARGRLQLVPRTEFDPRRLFTPRIDPSRYRPLTIDPDPDLALARCVRQPRPIAVEIDRGS